MKLPRYIAGMAYLCVVTLGRWLDGHGSLRDIWKEVTREEPFS